MDITPSARPPGEASHRGLTYRPEIDGLRAVAVLAVVAYHAMPASLPGGFVGVDVFFVISGYLITSLLVAEHARTGRLEIPAFYARRALRLLPALFTVVLATVSLAMLFAPMGAFVHSVVESAAASLLFFGNVYFDLHSGGYFDGPAEEMPMLHLWSLGVEEQFYLVYPMLLWVFLRRADAARKCVLLLCVVSLLAAEAVMPIWPQLAFFEMPARFWELGLGGLLALTPRRDVGGGWSGVMATAGLALIGAAAAWPGTGLHFPGIGALPAVIGSTLVLAATHGSKPGHVAGVLRTAPVVFVGLVSYGFYLWHWPLLALDRAIALGEPPAVRRVALCMLAFVLAAATYRWIERPLRTGWRVPPRRVLATAGIGIALALAVVLGIGQQFQSQSDLTKSFADAHADRPSLLADCHYGVRSRVQSLIPPGCLAVTAGARVALWGDSHALAWQPFAAELAGSRGQTARMMTMDSCTPVRRFAARRTDAPAHRENCARFNSLVLEELAHGRYDTVVIAARWLSLFTGGTRAPRPGRTPMPEDLLAAELDAAVAALAHVPLVLLVLPPPESPYDAPKCIASRYEAQCTQARSDVVARRAPARRTLEAIAARHPNVKLVDPLDFFCDAVECPIRRDDLVFYWDDNHVSASASREFGRAFVADPVRFAIVPESVSASASAVPAVLPP